MAVADKNRIPAGFADIFPDIVGNILPERLEIRTEYLWERFVVDRIAAGTAVDIVARRFFGTPADTVPDIVDRQV